jgi:hypothetical protein
MISSLSLVHHSTADCFSNSQFSVRSEDRSPCTPAENLLHSRMPLLVLRVRHLCTFLQPEGQCVSRAIWPEEGKTKIFLLVFTAAGMRRVVVQRAENAQAVPTTMVPLDVDAHIVNEFDPIYRWRRVNWKRRWGSIHLQCQWRWLLWWLRQGPHLFSWHWLPYRQSDGRVDCQRTCRHGNVHLPLPISRRLQRRRRRRCHRSGGRPSLRGRRQRVHGQGIHTHTQDRNVAGTLQDAGSECCFRYLLEMVLVASIVGIQT